MNWRLLSVLPPLAAIAALIVWPFVLVQTATTGERNSGVAQWELVIGIAIASLLSLWAAGAKANTPSLALWLSAGLWAGASYVSADLLGLPQLAVALLTLGGAAVREHERGKTSLSGPIGFLAAIAVQIAGFSILSR